MPSLLLCIDFQRAFHLLDHLHKYLTGKPIARIQFLGDNLLRIGYQNPCQLASINAPLAREVAFLGAFCILGYWTPSEVHVDDYRV